jgi:hypothetical protein
MYTSHLIILRLVGLTFATQTASLLGQKEGHINACVIVSDPTIFIDPNSSNGPNSHKIYLNTIHIELVEY